ncbi:MAG: class I SAM-dependent methyltransferase [Chlamydiia bacterium]|nr:class I SAM-dependent methyltransferase [Chlamydiia bacterium]
MTTAWEEVDKWYDRLVGLDGSEMHQAVILPKLKEKLGDEGTLLDVGCGQGILARQLSKGWCYHGIDLSPSLIAKAKKYRHQCQTTFQVADATKPFKIPEQLTTAFALLSLQNMKEPSQAIATVANALPQGGSFHIVLNHPCFRIPRQSSWGIDPQKNLQYRRIDRYMTPMEIPIDMYPGKTLSFHHPLSQWVTWLTDAGLALTALEEWCSPKTSTGKMAKRENRARTEFPLFLYLCGKKWRCCNIHH